jgi:hypothetical protein
MNKARSRCPGRHPVHLAQQAKAGKLQRPASTDDRAGKLQSSYGPAKLPQMPADAGLHMLQPLQRRNSDRPTGYAAASLHTCQKTRGPNGK